MPDFRRAVLTPLAGETTLSVDGVPVWRTDGAGDLAVMIAEWFAYIADILTFYNERIANQDYLRTADLPESVDASDRAARLSAAPGDRRDPARSRRWSRRGRARCCRRACSSRASQRRASRRRSSSCRRHADRRRPTRFQQHRRRCCWRSGSSTIAVGVLRLQVILRKALDDSAGSWRTSKSSRAADYSLLLQGAVDTIDPGALLVLRPRDAALGNPLLATVTAATVAAGRRRRTADGAGFHALRHAACRR